MTLSTFSRAIGLALVLTIGSAFGALAAGPNVSPTPGIQPTLNLPFTGTLNIAPTTQDDQTPVATLVGQTQGDLATTIQAQLTPAQFAGGRRQSPRSALLKGTVTIRDPAGATTWFSGDAQATLNDDGTGVLGIVAQGVGPYQGASLTLEANYTVDPSGALSGQLTGGMNGALTGATAVTPAPAIDHTYWYLSRAGGILAYLLLCVSVLLGLAVRTKAGDVVLGRWRVYDLHQTAALTAVAFLFLHVFSLLGDQYFGFTVSQLLVPFSSPYRLVWVAAGVFAFYLMLVLTASFYVRRWITYRVWRSLHYLTFLGFVLALAHGIFAGTDTSQTWARDMYWITGAAVAIFTIYRMPSGAGNRSGDDRASTDSRQPPARPSPAATKR